MGDRFTTFDSSFPPAGVDYFVGYGLISGSNVEKRWTITQLISLTQSTINISKLDGGSDNYVEGVGTAAGGGQVTIRPNGTDVNADLVLEGKGTGVVQFNGTLVITANLDLNGNDLLTTGGDVLTAGGAINTANGALALGSGALDMASGDLTLTTGNIIVSAGDITLSAGGTLDTAGGTLKVDAIEVAIGAAVAIDADIVVGGALNNHTITVANITGNKDAPAAGLDPVDVLVTGDLKGTGYLYAGNKFFGADDVITETYLKASIAIGLTADAGSTQGDGLIAKEFNQYSTVGSAGDCATLPVLVDEGFAISSRTAYTKIIVRNDDGVNSMDVFPSAGGQINALGLNNPYVLAAGSVITFYGVENGGSNTWFTA